MVRPCGCGGVDMRIKQLELVGFKSFPQRTILNFPAGVTGIVGPNGCGKSNVVDAIRWVLGEQSPKHLRGDAMEAVIFGGNEKVAPLGLAEVSLTFDNDGTWRQPSELDLEVSTLPAHVRDLAEITVSRRYFRSGESEYFINKTACRLKDITELFLGTGIGSKAYAIIEQGRVEQLINAKPEDRRLFIEEAAGTTLYRSRKLAAERKMERTRENLARVNDILIEIERQAQYLQRQAKKAEVYKRLIGELRERELRAVGRQWRMLQWELGERQLRRAALAEAIESRRASLVAIERQHAAAAAAWTEAEQQHGVRREQLAVLEAERESVRQRIALLTGQRDERDRRLARLVSERAAMASTEATTADRLRQAEREREAYAQYLLYDEGALREREADLAAARGGVAVVQQALEDAKTALVEHVTREVEARNAAAGLARRREEMARQLDKLHAEQTAVEGRRAEIDTQLGACRGTLDRLRGELADATGAQAARSDELRALAEARRRVEREALELEGAFMQARSRLESLEQIQANYDGFHRGVRAIMRAEQHADGVLGVVADVIDIPQPYERAVAAVLGERLQYVIVRGEADAASAVDRLRQGASGRSSFIPLKPRVPDLSAVAKLNGTSRRLVDLVSVDAQFESVAQSLLGEVVLVPDLESAIGLWRQNGVRVTLVTPEGDVIDPAGVITGGSDRPIEEEILARRREIEQLRGTVEAAARQLTVVRTELEQIASGMTAAEEAVRALGQGAHELTVRIVAVEKDIERLEIEQPQCLSRRDVIRYEIDALQTDVAGTVAEAAQVSERLRTVEGERALLEEAVAAHRTELAAAIAHTDAVAAELTALKVRVAERRSRQQGAATAVDDLRRQQDALAARRLAVDAEHAAATAEHDQLARDLAAAAECERAQVDRRAALADAVATAAGVVGLRSEAVREIEQRDRVERAALETLREEHSQAGVAHSEVRLRAEHLVEAMREKYECALDTIDPGEPEGDAEAERQQVEALRQRLHRLGEVNVSAIDELRDFEERGSFLRAQRDDLERSLGDLERTIQKLNRASRTRFAETFARANETFQKVFPRLFRGGEGRLVLTNEHDLLETGVEIVVRPPGKRLDTVSLLSGGEKALVAVSLIFSLFLINPTPFCILDEVDAPLDDANIGRFSQMIREMSAHSQFILITHNKRTMESADVLYGVTMQEPGVSKILSVAID